VLTRATAVLAGVFFVTSLVLSILAGLDRKPRSIIQNTGAPQNQQAPAPQGGNLLDQLKQGGGEQTPPTRHPGRRRRSRSRNDHRGPDFRPSAFGRAPLGNSSGDNPV